MLHIALCDDESNFLLYEKSLILNYMEGYDYLYQIDLYQSGKELLAIKEEIQQYNMIFLDIHMGEINGIETAKQIRRFSKNIFIVFVTAFDTYALEGYKVNAIRFLLKDKNLELTFKECLDAVLLEIENLKGKQRFKFIEGTVDINLDDLVYVESNLHRLIFYVRGTKILKYTMYSKLDCIEECLEKKGFCRIHKSFLVNMKYVYKIRRYEVELYDGRLLNIAKTRFLNVNNQFASYQGRV